MWYVAWADQSAKCANICAICTVPMLLLICFNLVNNQKCLYICYSPPKGTLAITYVCMCTKAIGFIYVHIVSICMCVHAHNSTQAGLTRRVETFNIPHSEILSLHQYIRTYICTYVRRNDSLNHTYLVKDWKFFWKRQILSLMFCLIINLFVILC